MGSTEEVGRQRSETRSGGWVGDILERKYTMSIRELIGGEGGRDGHT